MRAARYFKSGLCGYCRNRRFHTYQEHMREWQAVLETQRHGRRRRAPGAPDFNAHCIQCLRGNPHTDGEHERQIELFNAYDGIPEAHDQHDGYPY